jgi:hypothetical protein
LPVAELVSSRIRRSAINALAKALGVPVTALLE